MSRQGWTTGAWALAAAAAVLLAAPLAYAGGTIAGKVTSKKKRNLVNAVVYVEKVEGEHKPPAEPVVMNQRNQQFVPKVLPVVQGTTVAYLNSDNTGHNVYSPDGEEFDLGTWPKGERRNHTYARQGVYAQLCKLHASMSGYVVVLQNPYFATSGEDGSFKIEGVPPGTYTLKTWHARVGARPVQVTVEEGKTASVELPLSRKLRGK